MLWARLFQTFRTISLPVLKRKNWISFRYVTKPKAEGKRSSCPKFTFFRLPLEPLDVPVGFHAGHDDIEEPQTYEKNGSGCLVFHRTSELSSNFLATSEQQHHAGDEGATTKHCYRKGETAGLYLELGSSEVMNNCS